MCAMGCASPWWEGLCGISCCIGTIEIRGADSATWIWLLRVRRLNQSYSKRPLRKAW